MNSKQQMFMLGETRTLEITKMTNLWEAVPNNQHFRAILSHLSHKCIAALHDTVGWADREQMDVQWTLSSTVGKHGVKKKTKTNKAEQHKHQKAIGKSNNWEKKRVFPGLHLLWPWCWSLCLGFLWGAWTVKLMHTRPANPAHTCASDDTWAQTGPQHINHSPGHSNPS